jgi:2-polyprenyl-3-methyl-5-hydroxy-6-metoxy-1,4-benzoquinol methylase
METSRLWDKVAEGYSFKAGIGPDYIAHFEELEEVMGKNIRGKKILEVGSGTGMASAYLAGKGAELYLVDISKKALAFQKKYFKSKNLKAKFYCRDAFSMKFPWKYFDVVWNGGVIEHFSDDKKIEMIKIMWRLVKPGGTLVIAAPNSGDIPFMVAKRILILRNKWAFGFEDDLSAGRLTDLAKRAGVKRIVTYCHNPVAGWWFFPYGREITGLLGLNMVKYHRRKSRWGHVLVMTAKKGG